MQNHAAKALPVHEPLSRQIVGIDALRLVAASLVAFEHLGISAWLPSRHSGHIPTHAFDVLRPYACYGWIGVEIFFVLSGFVIAYFLSVRGGYVISPCSCRSSAAPAPHSGSWGPSTPCGRAGRTT